MLFAQAARAVPELLEIRFSPAKPRFAKPAHYDDYLKAKIPGLREKPLAEFDLYHRDITPNIQELM